MKRLGRAGLLAVATLAVVASMVAVPATGLAKTCPDRTAARNFSARQLKDWNRVEYRFGHPRPTGSQAQRQLVNWLTKRVRRLPGMRVSSIPYRIKRWNYKRASLATGGQQVPIAGPVPYSAGTGKGGVSAPLSYVAPEESISAANSAGAIVIRRADPGAVPYAVFFPGALGTYLHNPQDQIKSTDLYRGDFLNYNKVVQDLRDAKAAGAKGLLFVKPLPRRQIIGHYEPYEGTRWGVPAMFLGADEGQQLIDAATGGASASLRLETKLTNTTTKTVLATLPGRRKQKVVVDSHTDGTSAVEDNGPLAMLAMAKYLSRLPRHCRPRTVQFSFTTAHFYQRLVSPERRHGGAGDLARRLDRQYDQGKVAGVVVLEHLGARRYESVPRPDGGPGYLRRLTDRDELLLVPVSPSQALEREVRKVIERRKLGPTAMIVGADAPDPERAPRHCSFGGQGTPYNERLLPTVSPIAAPEPLYDGTSGLEGVDFNLMKRQTMAFTDLVMKMSRMPRKAIAGDVTEMRRERREGMPGCVSEL